MSAKTSKLILIAIALCVPAGSAYAIDNTQAKAFAGRDVQITADELTNYHDANGTDVIVINGKVSIAAGADTFAGEKAVVWLKRNPGKQKHRRLVLRIGRYLREKRQRHPNSRA